MYANSKHTYTAFKDFPKYVTIKYVYKACACVCVCVCVCVCLSYKTIPTSGAISHKAWVHDICSRFWGEPPKTRKNESLLFLSLSLSRKYLHTLYSEWTHSDDLNTNTGCLLVLTIRGTEQHSAVNITAHEGKILTFYNTYTPHNPTCCHMQCSLSVCSHSYQRHFHCHSVV